MQGPAAVKWYPRVVFAPHNRDRAPNVPECRFDFRCEALIGLGELTIETTSTFIAQPGFYEMCEVIRIDVADERSLNISLNHGAVNMRWQAGESVNMPTDVIKEVRAPGPHCDDIHQHIAAEHATMQKMGTQGRRAAEVVSDDRRAIKLPIRQHFGENLTLNVKRCPLLGGLV